MSIVPKKLMDLMQWGSIHAPVFSVQAVNIGLTAPQATAFAAFYNKAKSKYDNVNAARQALRAATNEQSDAVRDFRRSAADTLALIKAFAENAADPTAVYNLAQIPPPAERQPLPPPGMPENIRAELDNSGAITLRWKCENPPGGGSVVYTVRRSFNPSAPTASFSIVGATGERTFIDANIPTGTSTVTYIITGQRGAAVGTMSDRFFVRFGTTGEGGFSIVAQGAAGDSAMKMAA